jgi:solute carrier family 25 2-oxodicarboxylate transporter 21
MWRNTVWNGLYYGSMHEADKALPALDSEVAAGLRTAALGLGLGMLATCFNAPFDVVKSRFQAQLPGGRWGAGCCVM